MANDFLWDLIGIGIIGGGMIGAYAYREEIIAYLKANDLWPFPPDGHGDCLKTCGTNEHLDPVACQCIPNGCTKTCGTGQVLNTTTCQCENVGTTGGNISFTAAGDWGSGRNNNWQKTV